MKSKYLILSTGFALFSMFFGSGNLVFPLIVGKESGGHFILAALGICLTGVLIPFLGAIGIMLFNGNSQRFFGIMGKPATFWFPLLALSLMGPFGVLARCITVAHGSFRLIFPHVSLISFSLASCLVIYLIALNKQQIVSKLGTWLTPFLLLTLAGISVMGVLYSPPLTELPNNSLPAFTNGFLQGYQTMDLLAAFFFSTFIIHHLTQAATTVSPSFNVKGVFLAASCVGVGLLSAIYISLVYLGTAYSSLLIDVPPQEMLGKIAQETMGPLAAPIVCLAVILACLTTAIVLAVLFSDFLKKEIAKDKINDPFAMVCTLAIAFAVSTLDFSGIASILAPILEAVYPALIVLTVINICSQVWGIKERRWPVVATLAAKLVTWIP